MTQSICVARDGEEALDLVFGHRDVPSIRPLPRLILLDLKLPKISGSGSAERAQVQSPTRPIPVVALTSSRQEEDMQRCYELGVNSYIQKPIDFERFQRTIQDLAYYWLSVNQGLQSQAGAGESVPADSAPG